MTKRGLFGLLIILLSHNCFAANQYSTKYNPWTHQQDYVLSTTDLEVGDLTASGTVSGQDIIATDATIYEDLYVGGTITAPYISSTYVPYTGATTDVNLGTHTITATEALIGTTTSDFEIVSASGSGNYLSNSLGIGVASPLAYLHIKAGTATANTAPIKLTAGTNLGTAESGTFEYDGTNLYFTP